jgi:FeS assembly SUF system protein
MKAVLKSLMDFGRSRPAEPTKPVETPVAEITQEELDMAARVASHQPPKPKRQMVDAADIPPPNTLAEMPAVLDATVDEPSPADDNDPALQEQVLEAIKTVRDPEIPVNLVDLGLIYVLNVSTSGKVFVEMTLTTPNCPSAAALPNQVREAALEVAGVTAAKVKVVFSPPWHQDMMSEDAKLELGLF